MAAHRIPELTSIDANIEAKAISSPKNH